MDRRDHRTHCYTDVDQHRFRKRAARRLGEVEDLGRDAENNAAGAITGRQHRIVRAPTAGSADRYAQQLRFDLHHLLDDPVYLLSTGRGRKLAALRDATWIAGCERCRSHLLSLCAEAGFEPHTRLEREPAATQTPDSYTNQQ